DECVEKLAAKEAYIGHFYFKREIWKSALPRFEALIEKYPTSSVIREAYSKAAISAYHLGEAEKSEKYYQVLSDRYSDSSEFSDARKALRR
ncbi:MAG: outer membrane protein assembly factor BamD, partial [Bdellovibrionota bacterium]